eukprot:697463-Prymnesium_polylepis.1
MKIDEWLAFCREEQHEEDEEVASALFAKSGQKLHALGGSHELMPTLVTKRRHSTLKAAGIAVQSTCRISRSLGLSEQELRSRGLTLLQFQQLLLSQDNRALSPDLSAAHSDFTWPMTHYWVACSHNSCISAGIRTVVFAHV